MPTNKTRTIRTKSKLKTHPFSPEIHLYICLSFEQCRGMGTLVPAGLFHISHSFLLAVIVQQYFPFLKSTLKKTQPVLLVAQLCPGIGSFWSNWSWLLTNFGQVFISFFNSCNPLLLEPCHKNLIHRTVL